MGIHVWVHHFRKLNLLTRKSPRVHAPACERLGIIDGGDGDVKPGGFQKAMVFSIPGAGSGVFAASIHP